jgi:hypothetical protein
VSFILHTAACESSGDLEFVLAMQPDFRSESRTAVWSAYRHDRSTPVTTFVDRATRQSPHRATSRIPGTQISCINATLRNIGRRTRGVTRGGRLSSRGGVSMCAREASACMLGLSLAACSTIPDVEYSYYVSKMNGVATAVQSVTCTPDLQSIIVVNTATFVPSYSADRKRGLFKVRIRAIEGAFGSFADSDANFGFFDDGRLKSINQSTTGQGETIIKSAVSLSSTFAGILSCERNTPEAFAGMQRGPDLGRHVKEACHCKFKLQRRV